MLRQVGNKKKVGTKGGRSRRDLCRVRDPDRPRLQDPGALDRADAPRVPHRRLGLDGPHGARIFFPLLCERLGDADGRNKKKSEGRSRGLSHAAPQTSHRPSAFRHRHGPRRSPAPKGSAPRPDAKLHNGQQCSRWAEAQERLMILLDILAFNPVASITIQFLNRPQVIQLGY